MSNLSAKTFEAAGTRLQAIATAIKEVIEQSGRFSHVAEVPTHFQRRNVGMEAQIQFKAAEELPAGSFYLVSFYQNDNKDSVEVMCVIRTPAPERGQAERRGHQAETHDITGKSLDEILGHVQKEIERVTPDISGQTTKQTQSFKEGPATP